MATIASQITSLAIVFSTVYLDTDKKTSKLRVTGLCVGNSPGTGEFPAQMASNAENVSIWWRHHEVMSHEHYGVKPPMTGLFVQQGLQTPIENQIPHCWLFVRRIHRWSVDSNHSHSEGVSISWPRHVTAHFFIAGYQPPDVEEMSFLVSMINILFHHIKCQSIFVSSVNQLLVWGW